MKNFIELVVAGSPSDGWEWRLELSTPSISISGDKKTYKTSGDASRGGRMVARTFGLVISSTCINGNIQ